MVSDSQASLVTLSGEDFFLESAFLGGHKQRKENKLINSEQFRNYLVEKKNLRFERNRGKQIMALHVWRQAIQN